MIRLIAAVLAAVLGGVILIAQATGAEQDYPSGYREVFMADCTAGGTTSESDCACMWRGVANSFSVPEYDSLDTASRAGTGQQHYLFPRLQQVVNACIAIRDSGQTGGYPQYVRDNFVEGCTSVGVSGEICGCGIRHMEREFTLEAFLDFDRAAAEQRSHWMEPRVGEIMQACVANSNW